MVKIPKIDFSDIFSDILDEAEEREPLKSVEYRTACHKTRGEAVYVRLRNRIIVFSGIIRFASTINFADYIIANISAQEGISPMDYHWFDLITHLGYKQKQGTFVFNSLSLEVVKAQKAPPGTILIGHKPGTINAYLWTPCPILPEAERLFKEYIGEPLPEDDW